MTPDMTTKIYDKASSLKLFLLLLLLTAGASGALAQTDYSGTYYIGSREWVEANTTTNFYFCPTEEWIYYDDSATYDYTEDDNGQPFMTTFQYRDGNHDASKAVWQIEKHPSENYYYIKYATDGRYLTYNNSLNSGSANRLRLHLETTTSPDDNMLFAITQPAGTYYLFSPKAKSGWYFCINQGNVNSLQGSTTAQSGQSPKTDGPTGHTKDCNGIWGLYNKDMSTNANMWLYLEEKIKRPTITFNEATEEMTITAVQLGVDLIYTTDGSTPSTLNPNAITITGTEGNTTTVTFNPSDGETTIKAVAVVSGELSNIAIFTTPVYMGANHKYLLQSVENTNFYMIQGDFVDPEIRINTSSLARPSMVWYFLNAGITGGIQYYYMVNNKDGQYACYYKDAENKDVVCLKNASDFDSSDQFKFSIQQYASGGYFIKPLNSNNGLNKGNGNNEANSFWLSGASNATARWNILAQSTVTLPLEDTSFDVSTDNTYYYKIGNAGTTDPVYYIIPPTGTTGDARYASTSSAEDDNRVWFFKQAGSDDWLNYIYIVNGQTGKYLYYNGQIPTDEGFSTSTSPERVFTTEYISESGKVEDRYQFVIAKTTTEGQYYIVPKFLKYCSNTYYYMLWRDGTKTLRVNLQRKDAARKWTFTTTPFRCEVPEVTYDDVNDQIEISSTQGVDVYYTIDGANNEVIPSSSTHYTVPIDNSGSTQTIRAVCARSADGSDKSDVVTIIFNPTITLNTGAVITYDGSSHQPTISSAEFNSTDITGECAVAKYLDASGNEVSECINAGVYTVVITDEDGGDYYVYGSTTFTINKASLTITPNDGQSKEYGDSDPVLTYTSSGLVAGDVLTGSLSRDVGENVGTYAISQGTLNNANNTNYDISFTTGKSFAITAKSLGSGSTPAPNITCDVTETSGTYSIVVKQGVNNLRLGTDYTKDGESDGAKYYQVTVNGMGNYKDGFTVKLAKIHLSKRAGSVAPGGAALFVSDSGDGNFVVPDNMTAYIVTGISGNTLITEQLDNIPDHVPVLLVSTRDANSFLVQPEASATPPSGTNLLEEATYTHEVDAVTIYLLYKGEFVLNAAGTLPAGKIYLPRPSSAPAPVKLYIDWDFVDGINLEKEELRVENEEYYTLDGIKLGSKPTRKGLYITNGRKVAIK